MNKRLIFFLLISVFSSRSFAEIKSPNYDFSLSSLDNFFPGKEFLIKNDKTISSDLFEDKGEIKIWRVKLKKPNYVLDLYLQVRADNKIVDLFARLPQHFLHDLILADLQKRFKKQDKFVRKDLSALYVWMNREENNILYHGSCSITCFPMFLEIVSFDKKVIPLYQKFNEALPRW